MSTRNLFICILFPLLGISSCAPAIVSETPLIEALSVEPIELVPPVNSLYLSALTEFKESAELLQAATLAWTLEGEEAKQDVLLSWINAVDHWQVVDMFRLVPFDPFVNPGVSAHSPYHSVARTDNS